MLKLKEIPLGSTDAKNELLSSTPEEIERFLASFVSPPALTIEKFISRDKYYIVGLKGTGKTALLRYISLKLEEENSISSFVLFKSEVDEDLRKDFSRAARVQMVAENSDSFEGDDFEAVWRN
jgi:predicted AAA+ superfamily ATPase